MIAKTPSERSFGLSVGGVCLAIAAWLAWRGADTVPLVLAGVGVALVGPALVAPALLRVPNRIWWRFAQALGWVNSRILLSLFFWVVLTPAGLLMRALGRDPLRGRKGPTNWAAYPERIRNPRHYERLF